MRTSAVRSEIREVMDIRQASSYLGISPDSLYKYASEGFIPAFKLGNRWRFKKSRIDDWMDQQSSASLMPAKPIAVAKIVLPPAPAPEASEPAANMPGA